MMESRSSRQFSRSPTTLFFFPNMTKCGGRRHQHQIADSGCATQRGSVPFVLLDPCLFPLPEWFLRKRKERRVSFKHKLATEGGRERSKEDREHKIMKERKKERKIEWKKGRKKRERSKERKIERNKDRKKWKKGKKEGQKQRLKERNEGRKEGKKKAG